MERDRHQLKSARRTGPSCGPVADYAIKGRADGGIREVCLCKVKLRFGLLQVSVRLLQAAIQNGNLTSA